MFQYINYSFLNLFKEKAFMKDGYTKAQSLAVIKNHLIQYNDINFIGILLSVSYFISVTCRLIFNWFSKQHLPFDLWVLFDVVAGITNIGAFLSIGNSTPEYIYNPETKRILDYYIILVLIMSWIRFFSYFLVVNIVGKLTITLFRMV